MVNFCWKSDIASQRNFLSPLQLEICPVVEHCAQSSTSTSGTSGALAKSLLSPKYLGIWSCDPHARWVGSTTRNRRSKWSEEPWGVTPSYSEYLLLWARTTVAEYVPGGRAFYHSATFLTIVHCTFYHTSDQSIDQHIAITQSPLKKEWQLVNILEESPMVEWYSNLELNQT